MESQRATGCKNLVFLVPLMVDVTEKYGGDALISVLIMNEVSLGRYLSERPHDRHHDLAG